MSLYEVAKTCEECGEEFWGKAGARCCSGSCRGRLWRKQRSLTESVELADLCEQVLARRSGGSASYSKLLPRLLRSTAAQLRKRGWDPIELLMGMPDEPVTDSDTSPGGIEVDGPFKRRWLHPPDVELQLIEEAIARREDEELSTEWYEKRREQLRRILAARPQQSTPAQHEKAKPKFKTKEARERAKDWPRPR